VDETLFGGDDGDTIYGDDPNAPGTPGNDTILGDAGADLAYGGGADEKVEGNLGLDTLYGDDGSDRIEGGDDGDTIFGGAGGDVMYGEASLGAAAAADRVLGGDGTAIGYRSRAGI